MSSTAVGNAASVGGVADSSVSDVGLVGLVGPKTVSDVGLVGSKTVDSSARPEKPDVPVANKWSRNVSRICLFIMKNISKEG